jgi:hypothetical protein
MATKKEVKMRDLKPSKDAKGGAARLQGATRQQGANRQGATRKHQYGPTGRGN